MARTGRRPGGEDTRSTILNAARSVFGARGFHGATIRAIAAEAEVDPALVHHYFGSKDDLFAKVIAFPRMPTEVARELMADGIENAGERIARLFVTVWDDPTSRESLLAMLRGAFTTEMGAGTLREFLESSLLAHVAAHIDKPDARLRASLAASQLVGFAVLRYVIGFEALAGASNEEIIEQLAPRIQSYLTGDGS